MGQRVLVAPLRTHYMSHASQMHSELAPGDVLVADRGFCSFAHLTQLIQAGLHGVLRIHQRVIVDFRKGRIHVPPSPTFPKWKPDKGLPRSRLDQVAGALRSARMVQADAEANLAHAEAYAALPTSILVRELRFQITQPAYRTREVTLATTLLDPEQYQAAELAQL